MRAVFESGFYFVYLFLMMGFGLFLVIKSKNRFALFGIACLILGFGDAFHLIPRAIGLFTNTLDNPSEALLGALGIGKLITSITMSFYYLYLYFFIHKRFDIKRYLWLDIAIFILLIARIFLCSIPANDWLKNPSDPLMGAIRNIPFNIIGLIMIILAIIYLRNKKYYKFLWVLILLSFAFYLPVVFLASKYTWVGMLMIPKTICYLLICLLVFIDYKNYKIEDGVRDNI